MGSQLQRQRQFVFDYLAERGPELWHAVADDWNWDNGLWILEWIIRQPDCERATAQLIFWRAEPEWFLPFGGKEDWESRVNNSRELYELVKVIVDRWNSGSYTRSILEFLGSPNPILAMESYRKAEASCDPNLLPWQLLESIGEATPGKELSGLDYDLSEGFPEELLALLVERFGESLRLFEGD